MASLLDPAVRCPDCGIDFLEFRREGRLGCPRDYDIFREQLLTLVERLHRRTRHTGKKPSFRAKSAEEHGVRRRLRRELSAAVAAHDYQLAAKLRDELREKDRTNGP
jgi:protein arginine kinase activator